MLFLLELLTTASPTTQHMRSSGTVKLNENYQFETISTVFDKYLESVCCVKDAPKECEIPYETRFHYTDSPKHVHSITQ